MTDRAADTSAHAKQHKDSILDTADNFYSGKLDPAEAAEKFLTTIRAAHNDGSTQALYKSLQETPYGKANVEVKEVASDGKTNEQTLVITPGFWQNKEADRKSVHFEAQLQESSPTDDGLRQKMRITGLGDNFDWSPRYFIASSKQTGVMPYMISKPGTQITAWGKQ